MEVAGTFEEEELCDNNIRGRASVSASDHSQKFTA